MLFSAGTSKKEKDMTRGCSVVSLWLLGIYFTKNICDNVILPRSRDIEIFLSIKKRRKEVPEPTFSASRKPKYATPFEQLRLRRLGYKENKNNP